MDDQKKNEVQKTEASSLEGTPPRPTRSLWKPILLLVVVVGLLIMARQLGLGNKLKELEPWIKSLGPWGPIAFIGIYIVAAVAAVPASTLTIAAGVLFGSFWGVIWVSIASTSAAAIAFLIARYFARGAVENSLKDKKLFQKLEALTREMGALVVAITRLVPIFPFNLLNYGFGLTNVPFVTYVFWSWLCMLPGTILYVVASAAVTSTVAQGKIPWHLVAVVLSVLVIITLVGNIARKKLRTSTNHTEAPSEEAVGEA